MLDTQEPAELTPQDLQSSAVRSDERSERRWSFYLLQSLTLLTLISGVVLLFYMFFTYRVLFHSDAAVKNILADEIIRTHQFFPSDWYYVNDIWILFPHIFIIPLALVFPNSFTLHAVACSCSAILFAASLYVLCKASGLSKTDFLFAASLLFAGLSSRFSEYVFGQFAYGGSVGSTFVLIALVFFTLGAYSEAAREKVRFWSGLLVLFLTVLLAGGVRSLFANIVPVGVALAVVTVFQPASGRSSIFRKRAVLHTGLVMVVALLLGSICFFVIRAGIHFQTDQSAPLFMDFEHCKLNVSVFFEGFLTFAGALPAPDKNAVSVYGAITAYRLFWFSVVLLIPFFLLTRYRFIRNQQFRFLLVYYAFSFVTTLYLYVFSTLPLGGPETFRYFTTQCALAAIFFGYLSNELRVRYGSKVVCFLLAACLPLYASSYYQLVVPYYEANVTFGNQSRAHQNPKQPLADYLVDHNLHYGYATYWNAGVLTILSAEKTRVNAVLLGGTPPVHPFLWLKPSYAYAPSTYRGKTFLLLTDQEYEKVDKASLDASLGSPETVERVAGYRVIVYSSNLAARLPSWEFRVDEKYLPRDLKADVESEVSEIAATGQLPTALGVEVENEGAKIFASDGRFPIDIGIHLYTKDLQLKNFDYVHMALKHSLDAGAKSKFQLPLPPLPPGEYVLEVSMVQEGVAWFGTKKDGQPLRIKLKVR